MPHRKHFQDIMTVQGTKWVDVFMLDKDLELLLCKYLVITA